MEYKDSAATEGGQRERLAAYFLAAPPYEEQTPAERQDYLAHLRQLGELDDREVLQAVGAPRPLVWGNPVGLIQGLLTAAQRLAAGIGQPLLIFPAREAVIDFETLLHPRLLGLAIVGLLRAACLASPKSPVWVRLQEQQHCLSVTLRANAPIEEPTALAVAKESARLHGGSLALCDHSVAFSCGRLTSPPLDAHPYRCPTAEELLRDTLSAVWTGFYSRLPSSSCEEDSSD
ncbi:MAG: hypothetical protein IIW40_02955 [Clostridia bacterium]|nr:hypothetical protein [Clostridia bacterium]